MPPIGRVGAVASAARRRRKQPKKVAAKKPQRVKDEFLGCFNSRWHNKIVHFFIRIRDSQWFQTTIIGVIFLAGILVGIQTYPSDSATREVVVSTLDSVVMAIFIIEIVVKMIAEGKRPHWFFKNAWNVFDFLIVAVGLMPFGGQAVTVLRLVRLLRVLKLVRALPKLRILVMGLLKSLSSIAYIGLLLLLLFYLYAVLGVSLFGKNDPENMGTLHITLLTLFRCATLEDWTDVMYTAMEGCDSFGYAGIEDKCVAPEKQGIAAALYFCSFVILSSMMILNLFIGVITSSMQDAKSDLTSEKSHEGKADMDEDEVLEKRLSELSDLMAQITNEVEQFAQMEKDRKAASIIKLSGKDVLANSEQAITPGGNTTPATPSAAADTPANDSGKGEHSTIDVKPLAFDETGRDSPSPAAAAERKNTPYRVEASRPGRSYVSSGSRSATTPTNGAQLHSSNPQSTGTPQPNGTPSHSLGNAQQRPGSGDTSSDNLLRSL